MTGEDQQSLPPGDAAGGAPVEASAAALAPDAATEAAAAEAAALEVEPPAPTPGEAATADDTPAPVTPEGSRGAALRGAVGGALGRFRRAPQLATPESVAASAAPDADGPDGADGADLDADVPPVPAIPEPPFARPAVPAADLEAPVLSTLTALEYQDEPSALQHLTPVSAHLVVLTGLATVVILGFLLAEPSPRWLLLLGAAAAVLGLEGTLRQTWREPFESGAETAPYLFVPALYMLGVPVLLEHNVRGELAILAGLAAGGGFGLLAWAELASVRTHAFEYPRARLIATGGAYLAGFAFFSLTYVFEVGLPAALAAVALAAAMLAVEVLREGEVDPLETLGFALLTGVVLAETRWLLYYLPLDRYLAGLTLLVAFYLVTGLLHSHITRAFSTPLAAQYAGIAAAGLALVVAARAAGLA